MSDKLTSALHSSVVAGVEGECAAGSRTVGACVSGVPTASSRIVSLAISRPAPARRVTAADAILLCESAVRRRHSVLRSGRLSVRYPQLRANSGPPNRDSAMGRHHFDIGVVSVFVKFVI
ncbi:hypothetical protein [Mycobacterium sp. 1165178.9]|uniref:hypothetical protein n=1 Tax=Mycobacterium sp. 1165178.9 TaxID=1834070 RepID=UPI0007FF0534|nr:hypothetical protein [Mycobacterium sp. 1165178.9]OBK96346.1 hypothetical protein A5652_07920 [Mycobacterium sp. 1165178.9]